MDFTNLDDTDFDYVTSDELLDDLIDYLIDLDLDEEHINRVLFVLDNGDRSELEDVLPTDIEYDEVEDIVSLYTEYAYSLNQDDGDYDDLGISEAVLNIAQRRKRAQTMRRFKAKLKNARKRMQKRAASTDVIKKRARRAAIVAMRKKLAGTQGANYAELTPSQKAVIDKRVSQRKNAITNLSKRLTTKVRQADRERLSSQGKQTNEAHEPSKDVEGFTHPFKNLVQPVDKDDISQNAPPLGWQEGIAKERWHKNFTKCGDFDRRFKAFKSIEVAKEKAVGLLESQLFILMAESEIRGIEVDTILANVEKSINESAGDELDTIQESVMALAKAYNITEGLLSITEDRDPEFVCESTGESCVFVSMKQMKQFETICDQLFKKFGIEFTFTKHFGERMSDPRNTPCLTLKELGEFVKKIYKDSGKKLKDHKDAEVVLKDLTSDINLPVALKYDSKTDTLEVVGKTVMRKANFKTPNPVVKYK